MKFANEGRAASYLGATASVLLSQNPNGAAALDPHEKVPLRGFVYNPRRGRRRSMKTGRATRFRESHSLD